MNRIYQGKVTQVEIPDPGLLSASMPFSASDGEKVAQPDEVSSRRNRRPAKPEWLLFHRDRDEARKLTKRIPELRQKVDAEISARAGWPVEEQKSRPNSAELLEYEKLRTEQRQEWQDALWQHHQLFQGALHF